MKAKKDTINESTTITLWAIEPLKCVNSGQNNVAIGYMAPTTPFVVDTVVYCDKCKGEHIINIGTYSKEILYKAKCGCEFSVSGNAR